jgi:hypothetical protein
VIEIGDEYVIRCVGGRFPSDGDVGVLRHVEGIGPALLRSLRRLGPRDPAIAVNKTMPCA